MSILNFVTQHLLNKIDMAEILNDGETTIFLNLQSSKYLYYTSSLLQVA